MEIVVDLEKWFLYQNQAPKKQYIVWKNGKPFARGTVRGLRSRIYRWFANEVVEHVWDGYQFCWINRDSNLFQITPYLNKEPPEIILSEKGKRWIL